MLPTNREGPLLTDHDGQIPAPHLVCWGCKHLRLHDWSYFYCRALGDQGLPEDQYWWTSGATKRNDAGPSPHPDCPFPPSH
jgi:hypothetical protein